jgi:LDH2 family malate/lactate/ureidoglycolate dehydrogenase
MSPTLLAADPLRDALRARLEELGVVEEACVHVAASLVETSLRGVDSHGIHLFPHYCRAVAAGRIQRAPAIQVVREQPSTATLDADHAFGHHAGSFAIDLALEKTEATGLAAVGVANSTHFGAAGYFAQQAARRGRVGFAFTNADALVLAHGGRRPLFGTNPICIALPLAGEEPLCLDMATSLVSWNKVKNHRAAGLPLGDGWAFDEDARPTNDPQDARSLRPIGGYKGFGLGMMIDLFCGLLTDGPVSTELLAMFTAPIEARRRIGHFFGTLRIGAFTDEERFATRLAALVAAIRSEEPAGEEPVMVPGDPEKRTCREREASGIPVPDEHYQALLEAAPAVAEARL